MAHLSLSLLGPFRVTLAGEPITGFESNKVRALLAYLVIEADRPHRRESLAALLWPDWPDRAAHSNLRHALANLRQAIGDRRATPPFLLVTRQTIQFNSASDYWLDVAAFTDLTGLQNPSTSSGQALSDLEKAVALYRGSFLEGFSLKDSSAFEDWSLLTRERLQRQALMALHRLAGYYEQRGEYERACEVAWRQVELEPWQEEAHQRLMHLLALSGQRSAALAQYETCRRLLTQELGVEPSQETMVLYESIRDGTLGKEARRQVDKERMSVMPSFLVERETVERARPVFVARERELAQLEGFLERALAGQGRVAFVTGDPGSGKTTLVQEFVRCAVERHGDLVVTQGNGNAHTGIGDPYLPFLEILQMLTGDVEARWAGGAITREHAGRLWNLLPAAAQALAEVGPGLIDRFVPGAALVTRAQAFSQRSGAERGGWLTQLDELVKRKAALPPGPTSLQQADLFEQYTQVLQALARQHPLVLVLDDLQWADAGSIGLLFHLGRKLAGSRILIVGAYRPGDVALGRGGQRHPLEPVVNEFQRDWGDICIDLAQAEGRQFVEVLLDTEPNLLGAAFRETLYRHTGGHPLFTVELLRGLQERGDLKQDQLGQWIEGPALNWEKLPARVEAVIAEHIRRLPGEWQATLAVASVEGEEFTAEAVARVQGTDEREIIRRLSGELTRRHRLASAASCQRMGDQRLSRYRFRHYLFQKYLYNSLDQVERAHLHEAVGNALEALYGEQAAEIALQLARHFQAAGITAKAVDYLLKAGERATRLSANQEAIAHLSRGLELLQTLPESPERDRRELALQLALGAPLFASKGFTAPQLGRAYARARELCQRIGETPELFTARMGLADFYFVRNEFQAGLEMVEQLFATAQQTRDPLQLAIARWAKGYPLFCLGEFVQARSLLEQVLAFYDPQQHRSLLYLFGWDMGVYPLTWLSVVLFILGYPDQASQRSREAIALARELEHPFTLAYALAVVGCAVSELRRDLRAVKKTTEELLQLGSEAGPFQAFGTAYLGLLKAKEGRLEEGSVLIRQSLATLQSIGYEVNWSHLRSRLTEAYRMAGQVEEGLNVLDEALAFVDRTGERFYEAELYRIRGELLLMQGDETGAEASFHEAIEVARRQQARSWELRAVMALSRLWQRQGRQAEACQRLAEVYGWFTEGFDTPDLQEAQTLLEELSHS